MRPGRLRLLLVLLVLLGAPVARAQPVPSLDLRRFNPPTDPRGSLFLEPASTPGPGNWNVGAWLSYARDLVVLEDSAGNEVAVPVEDQLSLDYVASVGIGERLALGLALPTVLYQQGDDISTLVVGAGSLPRTAIGDMAFIAKAALVPSGELGGFGLGALARVTAPTGDTASYLGEGAVTGELRLLAELRLVAIDLRATAGAKVRGAERSYVNDETLFGHDLPWGAGLTLRPQVLGLDDEGHWLWTLEIHGAVAITPELASGPQSPVLWGPSARYALGDVSLIAGVEMPVTAAVGSPLVRAVLGVGWAPRFYDMDGDGIGDEDDACAELAEDRDGFEDSDGCPDFDNDNDGVPDDRDKCPTEQEDEDEFKDDDGCKDPDNDGDRIPDERDACPNEAGPDSPDPKLVGCIPRDADGDGVLDASDRCPKLAEDRDGFQDDDGCPELDNDRDRVLDEDDACPGERGPARSDPKLNGCPSPDKDSDTFDDAADRCPEQPEDFDGITDDDGCPDDETALPPARRGQPLVRVEQRGAERVLALRRPIAFAVRDGSVEVDAASTATVRAIAQLLNQNPSWVVLVGVRPKNDAASQEALNKSFAVVVALHTYTHRDEVAESVGWKAVQDLPGARASGVGIALLAPPVPAPAPTPPRAQTTPAPPAKPAPAQIPAAKPPPPPQPAPAKP